MAKTSSEPARFIVGIDLGTTNSAVCYIDSHASDSQVHVFALNQLVAPGQIEARETLPSFHYEAAAAEFGDNDLKVDWNNGGSWCVGVLARDHGIQVPGRQISSAKSWLCHSGVDRTASILPWQGNDDVSRLSPVEVSSRYLAHIVGCWNAEFPDSPLAEQTVVLTIPASFEEVARNLTVRAAQSAGLPRVQLIEEPQAAFYTWLDQHNEDWEQIVEPGQKILVCDVGGGTSDFTLIRVRGEENGEVSFHRIAVGEHLILGGDNLDLTLAHLIEQKLRTDGATELTPRQWSVLIRTARQVKEALLTENAPEEYTVSLPGTGRSLIGGSIQCAVTRAEVQTALLDGFLPITKFGDGPQQAASGFREFGLPYAEDTAITRYLNRFLQTHATSAADNSMLNDDGNPARPDIILFNGGLFESPVLRDRMVECITAWFDEDDWNPRVLDAGRLDLAVAHGAACFGRTTRGEGQRIRAGLPRSYYIGVHTPSGLKAVCLIPAGTEPGQQLDPPPQTFQLKTGVPVEFPVFYSGTRLTDPVGSEIEIEVDQLTSLPPIRTVIRERQSDTNELNVSINCRLTEIGTIDLWCAGSDRQQWKLQFDIRSAVETDRKVHTAGSPDAEGVVDEALLEQATDFLSDVYGPDGQQKPSGLARKLAKLLGMSRADWPTSLLRGIWHQLIKLESGRARSAAHESNWLNLIGFALRPGFGYALDDWRVYQTWEAVRGQLNHSTPECRSQMWILWRRIAAGLDAGQQTAIASPVLSSIRQTVHQAKTGRGKGGPIAVHEADAAEIWRVLGAFENLPPATRSEIGEFILELVSRPRMKAVREPMIWALGRIGSRLPMGFGAAVPVASATAERWASELMNRQLDELPSTPLAVMQLARRTGDRFADVGQTCRDEAIRYLREMNAPAALVSLIRDGGSTDAETQDAVFGESLPVGLRVHQ